MAMDDQVKAAWIQAARLRTLPLAASGSLVAAGIAGSLGAFRPEVFALMLIVSLLLQVLSNFADDYGDLSHGLDDETRVGPKRGMQLGLISIPQMRRALIATGALTFALGCLLIYVSFTGGPALGGCALRVMGAFLLLGIAAIAAAVLYTVGPHPYGYLGLGDIMSFIFFGLVAVIAGSFLYLHEVSAVSVVAGVALGLPVAAVMNINNMRDSLDDASKGKRTIANRLYAAGACKGRALAANMDLRDAAAIRALIAHGPRALKMNLGEQFAGTGQDPHGPVDPERVAALLGERFMRLYHGVLVYGSLALFLVSCFIVLGWTPRAIIAGIVTCAAAIPLFRALDGVQRELDHTKLDRFMAPTSMGTVLMAGCFSLAISLLGLL